MYRALVDGVGLLLLAIVFDQPVRTDVVDDLGMHRLGLGPASGHALLLLAFLSPSCEVLTLLGLGKCRLVDDPMRGQRCGYLAPSIPLLCYD